MSVSSGIINDRIRKGESVFVAINLEPRAVIRTESETVGSWFTDRQFTFDTKPPISGVTARNRMVFLPISNRNILDIQRGQQLSGHAMRLCASDHVIHITKTHNSRRNGAIYRR